MTSRQAQFTIAVLAVLLLVLTGCNKAEQPKPNPQPAPPAGGPRPEAVNLQVILVYNNGTCQQYLIGAPTPFPQIQGGDTVTWTAKNQLGDAQLVSFDVRFPGPPFPFDFAASAASVPPYTATSGPANAVTNAWYHYDKVTINGQDCNNPGLLGFVMR